MFIEQISVFLENHPGTLREMTQLLGEGKERNAMLKGYEQVAQILTNKDCAQITASRIINQLTDERQA